MNHDVSGFPDTQRYAPVRLLGAGGMGAVYEVEDWRKGTHVALKVMLARDAARLLRFKQEFRVMAELYHPNLVRLFDLEQHEGQWFFTMELVRGQDLVEVLLNEDARGACSTVAAVPRALVLDSADTDVEPDASPLPVARSGQLACDPEALVRVVLQILDAIEFLHGRGILHRDLKPSNILVDVDGVVRLLDFGLASRVDRAEAISHEGAIVGTLAYLSPEQYRGEPASPASDLYALGCMMFQLLTGELPFQGSPMEALAGRTERPPPRVDERVPDAPPQLVEIVHRLMAMSPAERATIAQVREALGAAPTSSAALGQAQPAPPSGVDSVELFVGREAEVSALARCLEHATEGEPQIALVSGPSGIGKSTLADVVVRRARRLGFLCFPGRCYEREQVPFVAFDRVMDAMVLTLRAWPAAHLAALKPSLVALERIFPAVSMLTGSTMGPQAAPNPEPAAQTHVAIPRAVSGVDPRELRRQALDGFRALCTYAQAVAPLCFVLDDLQWADEESVALLSALLDGGSGRIMVIGLFRPEGVGAGHPLHGLLRRLSAEGRTTTIVLTPLGSAQAAQLVQAVTRSRLAPETSAALASQAGGNPFLVRRLAEHLLALSPDERAARLDDAISADDLLRTMIHALSPRAQSVLVLAATAGGDMSPSLLRNACELDRVEVDVALGELLSARFLRAVQPAEPDATPHLDVYHDRIREVAYGDLDEARRRALHLRLARAIEAQPAGRGRDAELLVRHFGAAGERALERRYAVEAAEHAAGKLAFARAARLFRIVLDDPDPGADPLALAARWEKVGDLFEHAGQHLEAARAYQEAQRRWDAAPEGHPERAVARLRLRGLAGVNLTATEHIAEGRAVFESGFSLLGLPVDRSLPERLAVLAALKLKTEIAERLDGLRASLPAARPRGGADPFLAAEVGFLDLTVRAFQPLWPSTAAEAALRAELLGRRIDDKRVLLRSLAFGAAVPIWLGRSTPAQLERIHRRLDMADELARAHDVPLGHEIVELNRSLIWLATSVARARRSCEAALEGFARRGMTESFDGDVAHLYYLCILMFKGDDDDALASVERQLAWTSNFITVALFLDQKVMLLCRRGRLAEAREALARLAAHVAGVPPSRLDVLHERARGTVMLFEGRFAEALAQGDVWERAMRESGTWGVGLDRSLWLETGLEAALGQLRRGALGAKRRAEARASAEWLVRNGVLTLAALGHRTLALLAHAEGRRRAALEALRRALMLTSANACPRHRWLALEAARDVGVITRDQEVEADELAATGRFVWPEGWVARSPARS